MEYMLLGLGIGLISILPPGPITVTLLHVGSRHGTRAAMRGAAGVAGGDWVMIAAAALIVAAGTMLPTHAMTMLRVAGLGLLAVVGVAMLVVPGSCDRAMAKIERPGRTLFLATTLTPSVLPSWIAILAAMPFSARPPLLALFALGVMASTALWHPLLGLLSGRFGPLVSATVQRRITRVGGAAMITLALALL